MPAQKLQSEHVLVGDDVGMTGDLAPYVCDLHRSWLNERSARSWREEDGTLLFFDISGFTPLAERLSRRGKAGVEQMVDILNGVFGPLVETAAGLGGDTLKFGGDALLVGFEGPDHAQRACAAAWDMQSELAPYRRLKSSAGIVSLRASAGVASGRVQAFLVGQRFRELVLAGSVTGEVMRLEREARAGEVLVSQATAAALGPDVRLRQRPAGDLLASRPDVAHAAVAGTPVAGGDPSRGLAAALHDHLDARAENEHRRVTVAFAQFRGLDEILDAGGPAAAATELDGLVTCVQESCERHGVTFLMTDADRAAGKFFLVAGAPSASTDDEDRMLHALRAIVGYDGPLRVRAGVNRGHAFAIHFGAPQRRTYTTMGDTTNLAARVMGKAPDGHVLATRAVLDHARAPFALTPVPPFAVKGKSEPIDAELVGAPTAVVRHAAVDAPLAGRDAELRVLRDAVASARGGEGRIVELVAEPGMGKSRLVAEVVAELEGTPVRRLVIEGGAYGTSTPYFALRAPLRRLLAGDGASEDDVVTALRGEIRAHMPDAEPLLPVVAIPFGIELEATVASAQMAADAGRTQLHFLLDRLLAALLPRGETLVLVEDAHWLDDASSELLRTVLRRAGDRGWAVFLTRRPGGGGLDELSVAHMRIELEPLAAQAADAMIPSDVILPPHVKQALIERSHGNPLFLRELIRAARGGADLDALPENVEALMTARIDTLVPSDRRILRRAAVLGQRFPRSWLDGMLDVGRDELDDALARLGEFLDVEPQRVRFQHALYREAAYEALPFQHRRTLHARAGELIERQLGVGADDAADILGLHFLRAREYARAWSYGLAAAEQARESYAHADAAQLYIRALEAAHALALPAGELSELYETLGEAHAMSGELARAHEAFTRARRYAAGQPLREAVLLHRHARVAMVGGEVVRAARWLLRATRTLAELDAEPARACRATVLSELAGARVRQERMRETIALCEAAIADAEAAGADAPLAHACYILDWALVESGRSAEAVHSDRAVEIYRRLGDLDRESVVLNNLGAFAYWEGRWNDAVQLYGAAAEACAKAGNIGGAACGDGNIAEVRSDQGRLAEARSRLERALDVWRATGHEESVAFAIALLGRLEARAGNATAASAHLADALERFRALRIGPDALWVEALRLEALAFDRRSEEALAEAERLVEVAGTGRLGALLHRARGLALAQLGDGAGARAALEHSVAVARERGDEFDVFLGLDALLALERDEDGERRAERDAIAARLDIAQAPPVPLGVPVAAVAASGG